MRARLRYFADLIRNSYWFTPTVMTSVAILLSFLMVGFDARFGEEAVDRFGRVLYTGGPEGARGVLSTIASSMITVAGVVFSITIVALQLASSQFGPRVLSSFMRDRGNQIVLGTFLSTFVYCLLVLRTIRNEDGQQAAVVPHISTSVAVLMALASLGVLIFFIHHVATSIQAPQLIANIAGELHDSIDQLYPEEAGDDVEEADEARAASLDENDPSESYRVAADRNGYIDVVDLQGLMDEACKRDVQIRLEYRPGQFVMHGSTLARIWPAEKADEELCQHIRRSFVIGPRRTTIQDLEFSVNQLVEVAIRALSPGINDPFTAINCIDRLGSGLCHLLQRRLPSPCRMDGEGTLRLVTESALSYSGMMDASLNQIRQNAGYHVAIYARLLDVLTRVVGNARRPDQLDPLMHHAELVWRQAMDQVPGTDDQQDLEVRYRSLIEASQRKREELLTESHEPAGARNA